MSSVNLIITQPARLDLARVFNFLNDLGATKQANEVMRLLEKSFAVIQRMPEIGRKYELSVNGETLPNVREVIVPYGKSGYSYLYVYDASNNQILILTVKHNRENAYRLDRLNFIDNFT